MHSDTDQTGRQDHDIDIVIVAFSVILAVHPKVKPSNQDQVGSNDEDHEDNGAYYVNGSTLPSDEELEQLGLRNFLVFHNNIFFLFFS